MKADVILADPPWFYNNRRATRKDNPSKKTRLGIGASERYSLGTMKTEEMIDEFGALVNETSTDNAYLLMWATGTHLIPDTQKLMEGWGFQFKVVHQIWVKVEESGVIVKNPGYYSLTNAEYLCLGRKKRGKTWHNNKAGCYKPHQIQMLPHPRDENGNIIHSRKPDFFHQDIDRWLGDVEKIELFATKTTPGWKCFGYDVTGNLLDEDLLAYIEYNPKEEM